MNPKETGKRIQLLRKQKGLSQEELADRLNVSSNTVAKIECGLRRPSVDFVVDLVNFFVSVKPSPAKTNRQAPTSLPVCLIIIIVFFGKIHPFPKCSLAFSVALVQQQIAVWIINLFRLLPLLEKCGFYNLKYPTVEIFARCGTICFYAVQDKISKEIFLVHRITVF